MVSHGYLLPLIALLAFTYSPTSSAQAIKPTQIIDSVCKQVPNYTFCVEAIYSDFRAPTADAVGLAQISYFYAYNLVANTTKEITSLRNNPDVGKDKALVKALLHCRANYRQADKSILSAFDNIDSEIYAYLKNYMNDVALDATDCEDAFRKNGKASLLTQRNKALEDICGVCIVVANVLNT